MGGKNKHRSKMKSFQERIRVLNVGQRANNICEYLALFDDYNARVFVALLALLLLPIDAFKLSLGTENINVKLKSTLHENRAKSTYADYRQLNGHRGYF